MKWTDQDAISVTPSPVTAADPDNDAVTVALGEADGPGDLKREARLWRLFDLHYGSMLRLTTRLGADDPKNFAACRGHTEHDADREG